MMVGREVLLRVDKAPPKPGESLLQVVGPPRLRRARAWRRCAASRSTSGRARSSAIAGVDGNGQTELIDALTGLRQLAGGHGRASADEDAPNHATAREMLDPGVGHIPEDRQRRGLVLEFSIAENIALHDYCIEPASKVGLALPEPAGRARRAS